MDLRKLKTLIDLVSESNVSELEITEAEGKVRIVKSGGAVVQQFVAAPVQAAAAQAPVVVPVAELPAPVAAAPAAHARCDCGESRRTAQPPPAAQSSANWITCTRLPGAMPCAVRRWRLQPGRSWPWRGSPAMAKSRLPGC